MNQHEYGREFDADVYDKEYFEGSGSKSGYKNYADAKGIVVAQFEMIRKVMENKAPLNTVLDVGCAYGYGVNYLVSTGWNEGFGFDVSDFAIEKARALHTGEVYFSVGDAVEPEAYEAALFQHKWEGRKIGLVTATELFEHIETKDVPIVISRMSKVAEWGFVVVNGSTYPDQPHDTDGDHGHLNHHGMEWWIQQFAEYGQIDFEAMFEFNKLAEAYDRNLHWHNRAIVVKFA